MMVVGARPFVHGRGEVDPDCDTFVQMAKIALGYVESLRSLLSWILLHRFLLAFAHESRGGGKYRDL